MTRKLWTFGLLVGTCVALVMATARPALAQGVGSLRGKVVDAMGKPVEGAEVTLDFVGDYTRQFKTLTDKNGEWVRAGMPSSGQSGGTWTLTVKKGDLVGMRAGVRVMIGTMTRVEDIVIAEPGAGGAKVDPSLSAEEVERRNKRQTELQTMFEAANADIDAGRLDDALAKVNTVSAEVPDCTPCYSMLGRIHVEKKDLAEAEKAFLKAIELENKEKPDPGPYAALATIYNSQRKFEEATKMSERANELLGGTEAGGDASTIYNQGIILWNQSKVAEAADKFAQAIKLDPKMADAHYWLGMSLVSQGKMQEAKVPLQEYLKLAPDGANAATAKAILDQIK